MTTEVSSMATGLAGASVGRRTGQYLLAIDWLSEDADRVAPGELAARLGVSGASVTEMSSKLEDAGLVTVKKYTGVKLTDKGSEVARELAWRLCVVENFSRRNSPRISTMSSPTRSAIRFLLRLSSDCVIWSTTLHRSLPPDETGLRWCRIA
ncbi:metal-dependent transcriptional regulator [Haloplanus sp. GCM10025708]|uniref:metal-dependent transcriptional regulator n=1 Tax=Haloplanus sp. GCM10025708 TaxID=3252679 RepID=UPI003608AEC5